MQTKFLQKRIQQALARAKKASSKAGIVGLTNGCNLPREAILAQWLDALGVWCLPAMTA